MEVMLGVWALSKGTGTSLAAQTVKSLPAKEETQIQSLGQEIDLWVVKDSHFCHDKLA